MAKRKKEKAELDTETTIADMNVEGFRWYNPNKKKNATSNQAPVKLTKKERIAMIKGAFQAVLPFVGVVICIFVLVFAVAYLWLK